MSPPSDLVEATCHCGAVRIEMPAPSAVTDCNCSICRRMGVLWAYDAPDNVRIAPPSGATDTYAWGDRSLEFHRCKVCGNVTHWSPIGDRDPGRMGVNARLMGPEALDGVEMHHLDGAGAEEEAR
jgi:hypothetical protein